MVRTWPSLALHADVLSPNGPDPSSNMLMTTNYCFGYFEYIFAIQLTFFKMVGETFLSLNATARLFRCSRVHIGRQPFLNYQPPHLLWSVAEDVQNGGLGLHWYLPVSHTLTIASTMVLGSEKLFCILHNSSNRRHRVRITCSGWVSVSVRPDKSGNYMEL